MAMEMHMTLQDGQYEPTTSTQGPPKKLRLSCDACLGAKVKCNKERPCARCLAHGRPCIYSTTRRVGKPKGCCKKSALNSPCSITDVNKALDAADSLRRHSITTSWDEIDWSSANSTIDDTPYTSSYEVPSLVGFDDSFATGHSSFNLSQLGMSTPMSPASYSQFFGPTSTSSEWSSSMSTVVMEQSQSPLAFSRSNSTSDMLNHSDAGVMNMTGTPLESTDSADHNLDCSCRSTLQQRIQLLTASLPFDELMAMNQAVYFSMLNYLSCTCRPDISSIMLLSSIVSQLVQVYKTVYKTEVLPLGDSVVTVGMLKIDSFDEHKIKLMLVRSELLKVRALIHRFPERFENYLDGAERRLYRANIEYLESDLDDMISKGVLMLTT